MIWVDDVQKGSQVEWPLQHTTALLGLHGACACKILLKPTHAGQSDGETPQKAPIEAVLEVFLPSNLTTAQQQQKSVESLWNHLQSAVQLRMANQEQVGQGVVSHNDRAMSVGGDRNGADGAERGGLYQPSNAPGQWNTEEHGPEEPPWGITLSILSQHFNKHLKDAARTSAWDPPRKRICRHFGIARWPRRASSRSRAGCRARSRRSVRRRAASCPAAAIKWNQEGSVQGYVRRRGNEPARRERVRWIAHARG